MTAQGEHIVLKCLGPDCGMRYPSPADDPRRDACPLCESPVSQLARYDEPPLQQLETLPGTDSSLVGVLDSIRSALNVGAMLRSADGAGLTHLYLGGLTARADNPKVIKTALGAQEAVPTTSYLDIVPQIAALIDEGYEIWAVDFTSTSVPLQACVGRPSKLAFVVGNERAGVDPDILAMAHRHVHLDMHGTKTTLNVGVAFGVVAHWTRSLPVAGG